MRKFFDESVVLLRDRGQKLAGPTWTPMLNERFSEDELKQFCLANTPAYAHPRSIGFVAELPLNGPGKIDRKVVSRLMCER